MADKLQSVDAMTRSGSQRVALTGPVRALTQARIALESSGVSLGTRDALDFARCHALARDAVHAALDSRALLDGLKARGLDSVVVRSAAPDRPTYLRRPDLGRRLDEGSASTLSQVAPGPTGTMSLGIILADGLSALAVDRHALLLLDTLLPLVSAFHLRPVAVALQARVALGDQIGAALRADLSIMLIGERPGLSAPDSLGAYITWAPRAGRTDAERNCISNIREGGLDYVSAAGKVAYLCTEAARLGQSGTALKEAAPEPVELGTADPSRLA